MHFGEGFYIESTLIQAWQDFADKDIHVSNMLEVHIYIQVSCQYRQPLRFLFRVKQVVETFSLFYIYMSYQVIDLSIIGSLYSVGENKNVNFCYKFSNKAIHYALFKLKKSDVNIPRLKHFMSSLKRGNGVFQIEIDDGLFSISLHNGVYKHWFLSNMHCNFNEKIVTPITSTIINAFDRFINEDELIVDYLNVHMPKELTNIIILYSLNSLRQKY